jgi:hypothetical protein
MGWMEACRVALGLNEDNEDINKKYLFVTKCNVAQKENTLELRLDISEDRNLPPRIEWIGDCDLKADDFTCSDQAEGERSKLKKAKEIILDLLQEGAKPSNEIFDTLSNEHHISKRTVWSAKRELDIKATKTRGGYWQWYLNNKDKNNGEYDIDEINY